MKLKATLLAIFLGSILLSPPCQQSLLAATQLKLADANTSDAPRDPAAMLASARTLLVNSRSALVKSEVIESELQKRSDFRESRLLLTKDATAADLVIEVRRSSFTTEYPFVVIDTRTKLIVASGKVNSLFGTAAGKIAKSFSKQLQQARRAVTNDK